MSHRPSPLKYILRSAAGGLVFSLLLIFLIYSALVSQSSFTEDLMFVSRSIWSLVLNYGHVLLVVYICSVASLIFLENRNPDSTITWLMVLGLLPFVGVILYWLIGPDLRYYSRRKKFTLPKGRLSDRTIKTTLSTPFITKTATLIHRSSGADLCGNCRVTLLVDGPETFGAMITQLRSARKSIVLESYIISNDGIGNSIKDILIQKAREGVTVCVIYDAVGSWKIGRAYVAALRQAGVRVLTFLPVAFPMLRGANYRNHRKILVVDGHTAFLGGFNINDCYLTPSKKSEPWRDTHLMLQGSAAQSLLKIFIHDLVLCGGPKGLIRKLSVQPSPMPVPAGEGCVTQIASSGPDTPWDTIKKAYISCITTAEKNIWITTPYLIPGDTLLDALCTAALSGVDVRILIPGKGDHLLVFWASLHCCEELLRAGVRLYMYKKERFIHAKSIVCDSALLSVGTANLDTRSLSINFEAQAFVYDEELAGQGEALFTADIAQAEELQFDLWRTRPLYRKVQENIGKLIAPLA